MKYFDQLLPLLKPLHEVGCGRDSAGNRELHFDQYCLLVLLFLFNPIVSGLRAIEQISELEKVQKRLEIKRTSFASLSEAASSVFDAELLKPIIEQIGEQLQPLGKDPGLQGIDRTLTLVDGSLISALPSLAEASCLNHTTGKGLVKWRLHTHFEVERFAPERIDVTRDGGRELDERAVTEKNVESDRCFHYAAPTSGQPKELGHRAPTPSLASRESCWRVFARVEGSSQGDIKGWRRERLRPP